MMNQNKKNNGWILCPSKSFPGKFYYFNVVTGEAAWSLGEIENQTAKRDYRIHNIADKSHSFPEPSSPPMDHTPNIPFSNPFKKTNYNIHKRIINNPQTPMFGQAIFPKYIEQSPYMPNIIWTPIQLPPTMYVMGAHDMGMKMPMEQLSQSRSQEHSFIQTCDLSLSKRFEMYAQKSNTKTKNSFHNKFYETSTPIKNSFNGKFMDNSQIFGAKNASFQKPQEVKAKPIIRESILKRERNLSESENDSKVLSSIHKTNSAESLLNFDNSNIKTSYNKTTKVENCNANEREKLDSSDLRYLLVAKRRKSVDLGDLNISSAGKKIKTTKEDTPNKPTPKKRVTFDLCDPISSDEGSQMLNEQELQDEDMSPNNEYIGDRILYIAVDLDTLLEEYEAIEEYVLSDDKRRLLIPQKLQAEMEAACLGDCRGRQRVIAARHITRKLVTPPQHYVLVQDPEGSPNSVQGMVVDNHADDYILNICLQVMDSGDLVMLVTNNPDIYNDAKSLNIECCNTEQLKDGAGFAKPEVSFDLKKVNNTKEKKKNLFLQPASEFEPYIVKNKDAMKKRLFEDDVCPKTQNTFKDANTSPIDNKLLKSTDKLIDITRKKLPSMPRIDKPYDNAKQIGLDMQNLFIKDNKKIVPTEKQNANVRFENGSVEKRKERQRVEPESSGRNSLDECLSVYSVKNAEMAENIKIRLEEWICCFTQLMEDALIDGLMIKSENLSPPWDLYDAVVKVQELYGSHAEMTLVSERFKDMLLAHCSNTGKLKSSLKPNEFVKIVGCGIILIETLKALKSSPTLEDACTSLNNLFQDMSQIAPDIPLFITPVLTRAERENDREERRNYIKKPSEIIDYLKAHFPDWQDFEMPADIDENTKVVRTFGRDLNLLNITNNKTLTLNDRINNIMKNLNENPAISKTVSTKIDGTSAVEEKLLKSKLDFKTSPIVFRKFDSSFIFKTGNKQKTKNDINIIENIDISSNKKVSDEINSSALPDNEGILLNAKVYQGNTREPKMTTLYDYVFKRNKNENAATEDNLNVSKQDIFNPNTEMAGPKLIRTFENLFMPKINDKSKTTINIEDLEPKHGNTFFQDETAGPKVIRTFDNLFLSKSNDKSKSTLNIDDLNVPKHGNTFDQDTETAGPKVIRNVKPIDEFEGKLKDNQELLDMDALDYSVIDRSLSEKDLIDNVDSSIDDTVSFVYAIKKPERKVSDVKTIAEINDNARDNNDYNQTQVALKNDIINNDNINDGALNNDVDDNDNETVNCSSIQNDSNGKAKDDATSDSGFENDSVHAYSLAKIFLAELSESIQAIHEFIVNCINEFREVETRKETRKRILHEKANSIHSIITGIIDKLKIIIQRESVEESAVRGALMKAGLQAAGDKRITRYRHVLLKCLEQAQILENALKTVLALTDDLDASTSSNSSRDVRYFNIFE